MTKDKSKTFTYSATFKINGDSHKLYFRKEKHRMEFIERAKYLDGVHEPSVDVGIFVYDDVDAALNMVANYAGRTARQ